MVELCWVYCLSCCNIELVCLLKWRVSCCCVGEGLFIIGGSKGSCLKIELQRQSCAVSNCFRWIWCFWMFDAVVDLQDSVYMLVLYMCLPLLGEIIYFNHWRSFFHLIQRIADTKWCRFDQGMKDRLPCSVATRYAEQLARTRISIFRDFRFHRAPQASLGFFRVGLGFCWRFV